MKTNKTKFIKLIIALSCLVGATLYFFTPGVLLGGINYVTPQSRVVVYQLMYKRVAIEGTSVEGFDMSERVRHELDAAQTEQLRDLLQGSWYTRDFRSVITYRVPPEVRSYYHYWILVDDGERRVQLDFDSGGHVLRSALLGESNSRWDNSWLRIRNPNWASEMLQILGELN